MIPKNTSLMIQIVVNLIAIGVFIGITQKSLNQIETRLEKIEISYGSAMESFSITRERVAVLESKVFILFNTPTNANNNNQKIK